MNIHMEYSIHGTKWVRIKPIDACFIGELKFNHIDACSIW